MTTTTTPVAQAPEGFMLNARGHMVPVEQVREQDKLRDNVVAELLTQAFTLQKQLKDFKAAALNDVNDLVAIAAEKYGANLGGKKGNVTLTSFDGRFKVTRSIADRITFSEEIEAAKALIEDCLNEWTEGANSNVRALIDQAFRPNGNGQLKTAAILALLRLEIEDDKWKQAMEALKDSISVDDTAVYVRFYERDIQGRYQPVSLDIAAL